MSDVAGAAADAGWRMRELQRLTPQGGPISVVVATFGGEEWHDLAWSRAYPSAAPQTDVIVRHRPGGPIEEVRNEAAAELAERVRQGDLMLGDWLCFLDADDELAPGFIPAMEAAIASDEYQPAHPSRRLFAPAVEFLHKGRARLAPAIPNSHHPMPPLNHCVVSTVVHRDVFLEAGGFRPEYWPWSDYELWLRLCRRGCEIVEVPDAVLRVHVDPSSDNQTLTRAQGAMLGKRIHDEHEAAQGEIPVKGGGRR